MQRKWYNPKKTVIKKHGLVSYYEYKPIIYGSRKNLISFVEENKRKDYIIKKSNGLYMLCKKTKYYRKKE